MRLVALLTCLALGATSALKAEDKVPPPGTAEHDEALRRAQVWFAPDTPIGQLRLGDNPQDEDFEPAQQIECVFKPDFVAGSTPKFCRASRSMSSKRFFESLSSAAILMESSTSIRIRAV